MAIPPMDPVTALLDAGGKVIDRLWPDPLQAGQATLELIKLQQSGDLALIAGQLDINNAEAASPSPFTLQAEEVMLSGRYARDLVRRPTTSQSIDDRVPTGSVIARQGGRLRLAPVDFSADRRAADAELARVLRAAELRLQQRLDRHPVSRRQVRAVGSHLGDTSQAGRCRTSNLRPTIAMSELVRES